MSESTLNTTAHVGETYRDTFLGAWREQPLTPAIAKPLPHGCSLLLAVSVLTSSGLTFLVLLHTYYMPNPVLILEIPWRGISFPTDKIARCFHRDKGQTYLG